jgi:hypothetical protein
MVMLFGFVTIAYLQKINVINWILVSKGTLSEDMHTKYNLEYIVLLLLII